MRQAPRDGEPGALRTDAASVDEVKLSAASHRLGQDAARRGWARRFLLDIAGGRLAFSPHAAIPHLVKLAELEPACVTALLRSEDASAAEVAAIALAQAGSDFEDELIAAAGHSSPSARVAAAGGLAERVERGSSRAVDELGARLEDSNGRVRWAAACALGRARGKASLDRALFWLDGAVSGAEERVLSGVPFAAVSLWPARPRAARSLLLRVAEGGPAGRRAAAMALRELPRRGVAGLADMCVKDPAPAVRVLVSPALGRWMEEGSTAAWGQLERLARDRQPTVRAAAAAALAHYGRLDSDGVVAQLCSDRSAVVRAAVAAGLGARGDEEGMNLLARLSDDPAAAVRAAAVRGLAGSPAQELLRRACLDREPSVRAAAAAVLGPAESEHVELLLSLSHDRDGEVARAAARALGRQASEPEGRIWDRLMELAADWTTAAAAAEGLARVLDRDAARAADVLWSWPREQLKPEFLWAIARAAANPWLGDVARTLARALEAREELGDALRDLSIALADVGKEALARACLWMGRGAEAASLADIADAASTASRGELEPVAQLAAVARAAADATKARGAAPRKRHLARARAGIGAAVAGERGGAELIFAHRIAERWRDVLERSVAVRESARIRAQVASTCVAAGREPTLLVALENAGAGPACEVAVAVDAAGASVRAPDLAPGGKSAVLVALAEVQPGRLELRGRVKFRDAGGRGATEFSGAVDAVAPGEVEGLVNPYVVGKPLSGESAMFFGRSAEMAFLERALSSGENGAVVLLVGPRRTGKTSMLKRLEARLAGVQRAAFIDVQGMLVDDTEAFFRQMAQRALLAQEPGLTLADGGATYGLHRVGADMVREAAERYGGHLVLLLDEFDDLEEKVRSGRLSQDVFSQLRNLIQHSSNVSLVLSGTHRLEELAGEHWSFLLNLATHQHVGGLEAAVAQEVIATPLRRLGLVCEEAAAARAVSLAGRHPYFLQLLGYRLVEHCVRTGEGAARATTVEEVAEEVVEQGEIHLRYLWQGAGADGQTILRALSQSPEGMVFDELKQATGISSSRLTAGLRRLHDWEVVAEASTAYRLEIGLLGRWLQRAQPES